MDAVHVLEQQTVIVRDGIITEVAPDSSILIPPTATRIDGGGGYVLPGRTDTHVHPRVLVMTHR